MGTKTIPLTQGKVALVDEGDYEYLSQFKWHAVKTPRTFYAIRYSSRKEGLRIKIEMGNFLIAAGSFTVDHKDRDGLNNTRLNLRLATSCQNAQNRRSQQGSSSSYLGVSWHKSKGVWQAGIRVSYQRKHLGYFVSEEAAAKAYDKAAYFHFGEFANTNFPVVGG